MSCAFSGVRAGLVCVFAVLTCTGLVCTAATPAQAAAAKAKLVATPATADLGNLEAGAKKVVNFTLENQGGAEAKKVACKGSGFAFDKKGLTIAAGGKEAIAATYTAAKAAPAKAKALSGKITCGGAVVTFKGSLQPKAAAAPAAKPAETKPEPKADAKPEGKPAESAGTKAKNAPDKVSLKECQATKPPVAFAHKEHIAENKLACDTCHHTQKGLKAGSDTPVKKCASCHLNPTDKAPSCKEKSAAKNPYHIRCIGCHKEKGDEKAPTKCAGCHKG
ncbi:MAG: cytochrome c3 family protein [Deltaproteobacteria bacterium]|nr:cytochrome c3 family protein [Deltaproteobacteria bacterium]